MAKIQLKKSAILNGTDAFEPTSSQMLLGELAINYNANDPCIFFKDSDESIIRIAGKNAIGNRAIDIEGYPILTDGLGAVLDDRYLKLNSSGTQIVASTGLTQFSGGIEVTDSTTHLIKLSKDSSSKFVVTSDGKLGVGTDSPNNALQVVGTIASTTAQISSTLTAAQVILSVADGTAPLSVTSTTLVNNLNADTVDGLHATSFLRSDADSVVSNKVTFSDEITANSNIKLITDSKLVFGSDDLEMYDSSDGSFCINNKTGNIKILEDGTNVIIIDTANTTLKPNSNNNGSIGTSARKWNSGYFQNLDSSGTITANVINATTLSGVINASNLTGTIDTARLPATYTLAEEITIEATGSLGYLVLNADKNIGLTTSGSDSFVRFRGNNGQESYRFTKAGQSTIEGFLDFESLTSDCTFSYPNVSGTIALTTSTVANADNADKVDNLHASSFLRSDADASKTGNLILNTASNTKHLYIGRTGSTSSEYTKIGRNDSSTVFYTKNDESWSRVEFQFENTDTEGVNVGANASNRTIKLISNQTNASITVEDNLVWHEGNHGAGSSLDADLLDGQHGSYYTGYTDTAIANLIDSSPGTLDTLNELASALGDDANFSTTITNSLATKLPLAGGAMTGNITFSGTQTVDGRDLSVDGSKLDGIETNATADQTAAEILTLLKTVDTNSSGLNADKLDGQQGSYYQAASTAVNTSTTFGGDVVGTYNSLAVVNDSHTHDTMYYDKFAADVRFLGYSGKAADSHKLDNLSSGSFLRADDDDTYTGTITGNTLLLGGSQIISSSAKLQVNGFMRTGNINIHEGGNNPNSNSKVLRNNGGVLEWDGDTVWTSSNTGAGSSLNADKVDGYEGADLLKSNEDDSFSGNLTGSGTIYTTGTYMGIKGDGGGVCLTTNDGAGNANLTFNHKSGVPDTTGSAGRIECAVDSNTAVMYFGLKDSVTAGTLVGLTSILTLTTSDIKAFGNTVWHAGNHGATSNLDADKLDGQHGSYYTGYTDTAIANLIASSPSSLNTLNELAAALGDDANFSTTITDSIGLKLPKTGGTMSGNIVFTGSQTVDGRDLSVDGAKLDGIEAGATGDQTATEILNLLKTVDTNSSGLNAATVDGYNASSFLKSNANDTASGNITFSGVITIEDNLLKIGDTSNNNYSSFQHATSDGYGFDWEYNQASVIINEQGTTQEALVLGDVSATSGKSGLFGISHTTNSGSTWTKKLDLQGDGELFIGSTGTRRVWHEGNHGAGSTLDADKLDGQHGSYYQNATNLTSGTIPYARITDIGDSQARIITLDNLEKSNLTADGQLSFDSSQGLLVYRVQQGTSGAATTVLDGWNVAAGTGISITNLGAGGTTTEKFTFSLANHSAALLTSGTIPDARIPDIITPTTRVQTEEIRGNGTQLVLNAGEAAGKFASQTSEKIYLNAESGVRVSTPSGGNNFESGYATNFTEITGRGIYFRFGTTRIGEITCTDTTFLRINQETNKSIYTPRYMRADGGFFVDGTAKGINGSGNFIGGTIAGASDYGTLLRSNADDEYNNGMLTIRSNSTAGHYWGAGIEYQNGWKHTNADSWGFVFRNSGGNLAIYSASEAGTNGGAATYKAFTIGGLNSLLNYDGNDVWHEGNMGSGSGLDADNLDGYTWASEGKQVRASDFYADNWFRNYNAGEGLYNQATGCIFASDGSDQWTIKDGGDSIRIEFKTNGSTRRASLYADSSNSIGFLNNANQWGLRYLSSDGLSPNLYFREEGNETWSGNPGSNVGKIEYHSNRFYIVSGSNSTNICTFRRDGSDVARVENDGKIYAQGNNIVYHAGNLDTSTFLKSNAADTFSGDLTSSGSARIILKKTDNNVSDHIQFYNGTTRMGEIGCEDTNWLRINQETAKNIYTRRYIRADAGFFVDGTTKGINGSGNFIGGTISGASDYGTLLRSNANDTATGDITFNGRVSIRGHLDLSDGENLDFGSSDDVRISYNSNNWLYTNFRSGHGIIFQDNGSDKIILEDSGIFRPSATNTGTLGTSSRKWNHVYATTFTGSLSGNASTATNATNADNVSISLSDGVNNTNARICMVSSNSPNSNRDGPILINSSLTYQRNSGTLGTTNLVATGSVSKGSGSFKIDHPLPSKTETHHLVHSFIEGPQADLIYRGQVNLVDGQATINIDNAARMTEGTFEVLCTNVSCFTSNESDWIAVRGFVNGNLLTITAQDETSTSRISWMVVGERKDQHMLDTDWTDEAGRVITEPEKAQEEE